MKLSNTTSAICLAVLAPLACLHAQEASVLDDADVAQVQDVQVLYQDAQQRLESAARDVTELAYRRRGPFANYLFKYGQERSNRAFLGIATSDVDSGVRVVSVTPNGPAYRAGIESGDVVVAIAGTSLAPTADVRPTQRLMSQLALVDTGEDVELTVDRDGERMRFMVETAETAAWSPHVIVSNDDDRSFVLAGSGNAYWTHIMSGDRWSGMELIDLSPELGAYFGTEEGLLVVSSPSDATLGLVDGDVILDIGGRVPSSPEHALRILSSFTPSETLVLDIMRGQRRQAVEVTLPAAPTLQ